MVTKNVKNDKTPLIWDDTTNDAFLKCKEMLAKATLLAHPSPNAKLALNVDASNFAIGAALHQIGKNGPEPLAFFSKKLCNALTKASTYDRELYAIYESVKHFKDLLDAREFCIYTDHKPLVTAFFQRPERANPNQQRRLSFNSEYSTDIRHVPGEQNKVADMLSRIESISTGPIDFERMALAQRTDSETQHFIKKSTEIYINSTQRNNFGVSEDHFTLRCVNELNSTICTAGIPQTDYRQVT